MIFVVGGAYQGKLDYAKSICRERRGTEVREESEKEKNKKGKNERESGEKEDRDKAKLGMTAVCDGGSVPFEEWKNYEIIDHFHQAVRKMMEQGLEVETFINQLLEDNPELIIVMDEIGCGIVPIDAADRKYRDIVGQAGQLLAGRAAQVHRVVCGIGMRIK